MSSIPFTSVIIPTYNSAELVLRAVQALQTQTYKNFEIIIVDDGSTDGTQSLLEGRTDCVYVRQPNAGPAAARNLGASHARGDVLFFTDADCQPCSDWIERGLNGLEDPDIAVVAGSYGIANEHSLLARCIHSEIIYRHTRLMPERPRSFGSYNFAIRAEAFKAVGGFEVSYQHASGEDNDLSYKLLEAGYTVVFDPESRVKHAHPEHFQKYMISQYRHGFWRVKMYRDHPGRMSGDDYTFWKDIVEVPLSCLSVVALIGALFSSMAMQGFTVVTAILIGIEMIFGVRMGYKISEKMYLTVIMFVRAYVRTFGFLAGLISSQTLSKKINKS